MAERLGRIRALGAPRSIGEPRFRIVGTLSPAPAEDTRVEVWGRRDDGDAVLASGAVDGDGGYALEFDDDERPRPDVFLRATAAGRTLATSEDAVSWDLTPGETRIDLEAAAGLLVSGRVLDELRRPAVGLTVHLDEIRTGGERAPLGADETDKSGHYSIAHPCDQPIDVEVRVDDREPVALFGVLGPAVVDLTPSGEDGIGPSLIERVEADLELLGDPGALLDHRDAERLAARTGGDPEPVAMLARARAVAAVLEIPENVAFALSAGGIPPDPDSIVATPPAALRAAVEGAVDENRVPRSVLADLGASIAAVRGRRVQTLLEEKPEGAFGTLREALSAAGLRGRRDQERAVAAYVDGTDDIEPEARLALELATLTDNDVALIRRVRRARGPSEVRELAELDAAGWESLMADSGSSTGGRAERAAALAERLERAFPAEALLGRAASDQELPVQAALADFMKAHPDFALDGPPIRQFLADEDAELGDEALATVESLQRLLPLTPRYAEVRRLRADGVDSALAITQLGEQTFVSLHADLLGGEDVARSMHRAAAKRVMAAGHKLMIWLDPLKIASIGEPEPPPAALPDWETLFGSADFCECRHCASVVGPAAYLTDILHFLEQRPGNGSRTAKDVLFARRPDLGELELTCENTNTTLPYVDLVNEVLEAALAPRGFLIDVGLGAQLDDGELTSDLRDAFSQGGVDLPDADVELDVLETGRRWCVRHPGWRYGIVGTAGGLAVTGAPQTSGTSRERDAAPEHLHAPAYDVLRNRVHPWTAPFDLWLEEVRAFLARLGVDRAALMDDFGGGPAAAVAAERLGFGIRERPLLTGSGASPREAWGGPGGAWVSQLRSVRKLLDRAALRYEQLVELLSLRFVNPGDVLRVESTDPAAPHTCDTTKLAIRTLEMEHLDRIHRFVRLRKRLAWSAIELDRALAAMPGPMLDDEALVVLAEVEWLRRELDLDPTSLLTLLGPLDTHRYRDASSAELPSAYDALFRNRIVPRPAPGEPDRFGLNAAGTELALIMPLVADPSDPQVIHREVQETRSAIAGAIGVTGADLALLADGPEAVLGSPPMKDLGSLTALLRHALLARALGLSIADLLALKRLVGVDPISSAATAISPQETARLRMFVETARELERSGIAIAELDYLLQHRVDPQAPLEPLTDELVAELTILRDTLRAIRDDTRPVPDAVGEVLARKLVSAGWDEKQARDARELLGGTVVYRSALAALPTGVTLPANLPVRHTAGNLEFTGIMANGQRQMLRGLSTNTAYRAAVNALYDAPRTAAGTLLGAFPSGAPLLVAADLATLFNTQRPAQERFEAVLGRVNDHLRRTLSGQAVEELLSAALELSVPSTSVLLESWAYDPADPEPRLLELFVAPAFVDSGGAVTATAFPQLVRAQLHLRKVAAIVRRWALGKSDLELFLANAGALGWLDPATLPLAGSEPGASLIPWISISKALRLQAELPATDVTVLELLVDALQFDPAGSDPGAEKAAIMERWARATGWPTEDLEFLLGARDDPAEGGRLGLLLPGAAGDWNPWARVETWLRVKRCMDAAAATGATIAACAAWGEEDLSAGDARNALQALRAKHSAEAWAEVIAPISDELRERRREALVAELVARPPAGAAVRDSDDLFGWFLIDVEMAPCMTTSRLKQAISSVQLFAQRCLLNLEPDVSPGADASWAEWDWAKTYRVWEAARKIFLWPENWTQPELRDDKSPPFRELEEALAQTELDDESATDALQTYLERVEDVANLEVVGILEDRTSVPAPATREVHVVARTRATPPAYFYRKRIDGARWTPWEPVDADLEGDYVVPVVWNGRVHLLWPVISEFQLETPLKMPPEGGVMPKAPTRMLVQLAWTQRRGSGWTAKSMTRYKLYPPDLQPHLKTQLSLDTSVAVNGDLLVRVRWYEEPRLKRDAIQHFRLSASSGTGAVNDQTGRSIDGSRSNLGWSTLTTHTVAPGVRIENMALLESTSQVLTGIDGSLRPVTVLGATPGVAPFRVRAQDFPRLGITKPLVFSDADRAIYFEPSRDTPTGVSGQLVDRLQAYAFHHPRVRDFARSLRRGGFDALYRRDLQTAAGTDLAPLYSPGAVFRSPFPVDDVDFAYDGAYAGYNWELFFHAPLLIADRLMVNQRFEEAQRWLHRIFDPTDRSNAPSPQRFWRTRPFFEVTQAERDLDANLPDTVLSDQVEVWRSDPFNPHAVARMRKTAYQRATVMKYLDNLIGWGDQLFRRDTIESLNEATQLYVLAADILGGRPELVAPRARPIPQTYNSIAPKLDAFSNAIVAAESILPTLEPEPLEPDDPIKPVLTLPAMRYFCIPRNDKLLGYWDTVSDRLFKVRHCMNIEGVERQLALFEPPIDPGALVAAAAAGIDIGAAVADAAAPLPPYRFTALAAKATELCNEVKALGASLLAALEKRDAEALAALRGDQELELLEAMRRVRQLQVEEAQRNIDAIDVSRELTTAKREYYASQQFVNAGEALHLAMSGTAAIMQTTAATMDATAGIVGLVPNLKLGAPPSMGATFGGENLAIALRAMSGSIGAMAGLLQSSAGIAQTVGSYQRRAEEWSFQASQAEIELEQLSVQRLAAEVRRQVAERELTNHELQVRNAAKAQDMLEDKFTNRQLYDWMVGQVSGLYFRSFQLAFDLAKRAERAYAYELGVDETSFIRFGSWDSLRKGLLSGERLLHELKRMEASWLDEHHRHFELTKTVSLALLDPAALIRLRQTGECFITLPEGLFDLDHPGHYLRRLKSLSLSIPAVAGPYTNINARLTLLASRVRRTPTSAGAYPWSGIGDPRFTEVTPAAQTIATSHGQRDAGVFQVDFKDERYLPFEGQGAVGEWRLELDPDSNRFDLNTVSDVLIHLSYTARDGGTALRQKAKAQLPKIQLAIVDAPRELASEWTRFVQSPDAAPHDELVLDLTRLVPFRPRGVASKVARVDLYARLVPKGTTTVPDLPLELRAGRTAGATDLLLGTPLRLVPALGLSVASAVPQTARVPGEWILRIAGSSVPASLRRTVKVGTTDHHHLDRSAVPDLWIVVHYVPA